MNYATAETILLEVCVDCLMILANGELGQGDEVADEAHTVLLMSRWAMNEITLGHMAEDVPECGLNEPGYEQCTCEPFFSMRSCGGCGSTLGGDREYATGWMA